MSEIQKLKTKIIELKSLTTLSEQRRLKQRLNAERREIIKPLEKRQAVIDRIYKQWKGGKLALDVKTIGMLQAVIL